MFFIETQTSVYKIEHPGKDKWKVTKFAIKEGCVSGVNAGESFVGDALLLKDRLDLFKDRVRKLSTSKLVK